MKIVKFGSLVSLGISDVSIAKRLWTFWIHHYEHLWNDETVRQSGRPIRQIDLCHRDLSKWTRYGGPTAIQQLRCSPDFQQFQWTTKVEGQSTKLNRKSKCAINVHVVMNLHIDIYIIEYSVEVIIPYFKSEFWVTMSKIFAKWGSEFNNRQKCANDTTGEIANGTLNNSENRIRNNIYHL